MKVKQIGALGVMLVLLVGCKSLGLGGKRIDYGAGATQVPALELPPDLTAPASDERYSVPGGDGESVATFSDYSKGSKDSMGAKTGASDAVGGVGLREIDGRSIIVMQDTFDRSWRRVGLAIERTGLVVEDKDRAKGIYFLRPAKVKDGWLDKLQFWKDNEDTNMRYHVYVKDGGVACEVSVTDQNGVSASASKQLTGAIYSNLDQDGTSAVQAQVFTVKPTGETGTASLQEIFDGSSIIVLNDAYDKAWSRLGLAIERAGLVVENNDRAKGIYSLKPEKVESSLLDKLEFWRSDNDTSSHYRINLKDGGKACEVSVTDQYGASDDATKQMIEAIYKNISQ